MNHSVKTRVFGSYVPLTSALDPVNVCVSILSALFRDGCCEKPIVVRERAGTPSTPAALHLLQGAGFFVRGVHGSHF